MLSHDQFAERAAERMSVHVRRVDVGNQEEQIEHEAIVYDRRDDTAIANARITPAAETVVHMGASWTRKNFTDPGGQMRFSIEPRYAAVSHVTADPTGQALGAAHVAVSALTEHFNERPFADEHLTEHGARMSRAAVRRGLMKPHPKNPEMEVNISSHWFVQPGTPALLHDLASASRSFRMQRLGHGVGAAGALPVTELSRDEVKRAAQRLRPTNTEVPQAQGEQLSIQFG